MSKSKIEWTDVTWSPVTGCTKISQGCRHCFAERMARRLAGRFGYPAAPNHFDVTLHLDRLDQPLHWKKPKRVFVVSMGDLFHDDVPASFIYDVFMVMIKARHHTFQVLTKRPRRMRDFIYVWSGGEIFAKSQFAKLHPHIWLGVSVENQQAADERIPLLLRMPAAVHYVSVEPMLGPMDDLQPYLLRPPTCLDCNQELPRCPHPQQPCAKCGGWGYVFNQAVNQVIVGGESGPGARPMHPRWPRDLRDQCVAAGVPFFFKQWGAWFPRSQWEHNPDLVLPDDCDCIEGRNLKIIDGEIMHRVGKKAAGRLLDGRTWDEYPTRKEVVSGSSVA